MKKTKLYKRCLPDFSYRSFFEIPFQGLINRGIKCLFIDLDNTILAYEKTELSPRIKEFLVELKNYFQIVIISNSKKKRVKKAVGQDFLYVYNAKKPLMFGYKKALKMVDFPSYHIACIGDQLLTDIHGAFRLKAGRKILIKPINKLTETKPTRFNRFFEGLIIKKIKRKMPLLYESRLGAFLSE